jgi:hypothetical protein
MEFTFLLIQSRLKFMCVIVVSGYFSVEMFLVGEFDRMIR